MTHADVPALATAGLLPDAANPFTGRPLARDKTAGVTLATAHAWEAADPQKTAFNIGADEWLHVHDNLFDRNNWTKEAP
jgi:hypothetical protein